MAKKTKKREKQVKKSKNNPSFILIISGLLVLLIILLKLPFLKSQNTPVSQTEIPRVLKLSPVITPPQSVRVPILMYHYIEEVKDARDTIRQSLNINPFIFEQQVKTLKDNGYTFLTVNDLSNILDGKLKIPQKPVIITIDDGHWDLYTDILPILKKYQAKATAYIIPGFLDGSDFLSREQLEEVSENKLIEIGAHTVHHMWLKGQLLSIIEKEITESKIMLENLIKKPVVSFAYPSGAYDEQALNVVKTAGFKTAVSTKLGIIESNANRYSLFRIRPGRRTGQDLLNYLDEIPNQ